MDIVLNPSVVIVIVSVFVGFGICIICCFSCLKLCHGSRVEVVQPTEQPSVFIVPVPSEENNVFRPPCYSMTDFTELPPPYSEVEMKPDMFPVSHIIPPMYRCHSLPTTITASAVPNTRLQDPDQQLHTNGV